MLKIRNGFAFFFTVFLVTFCLLFLPTVKAEEQQEVSTQQEDFPDLESSVLESLEESDWDVAKRQRAEGVYLPILMYHQISKVESRLGTYVISDREFEADLQLLKKNGYETVTVRDVLKFYNGKGKLPGKPIMLTFDDGYESDYVYAFPLLKKYKMKAIFSIIGKQTELYSTEDITKHINYSHVTWDEVKEMHNSGLAEFQNHSYDMHLLEKRKGALKKRSESVDEYEKAITKDIQRLNVAFKEHAGIVPVAFTCPFGAYNDLMRDMLKKIGFQAVLTSYQKVNKLTGDEDELYHLCRFVREHNKNVEKLVRSWNELFETVPCGKEEADNNN
jgi:peptidoglycan/xylan/chitin deacetylase (PgdA/CDA1 family)